MIRKIWMLGVSVWVCGSLLAQSHDGGAVEKTYYPRGWYIGAQAGMSMGKSAFGSFGADKFRPGWSAGIHGGYRFTRVWSLEMTVQYGQLLLAEQDCCFDRGYFLGSDFERYRYDIPLGMQGWYYKDLKSRTFIQRYGLQANVNALGFLNCTKDSRWHWDLSPAIYAVGTSADLLTKSGNTTIADNLNEWHFGYGGQTQVTYALTEKLNLGLYGGFTHLTGQPMDGMPKGHATNFVIDAGVKFTVNFGKKKAAQTAAVTFTATVAPAVGATQEPKREVPDQTVAAKPQKDTIAAEQPQSAKAEPVQTAPTLQEQPKAETPLPKRPEAEEPTSQPQPTKAVSTVASAFPVIYFSFNSVWIEPSERAKVKKIAELMRADKSIRIRVTGWGDSMGGDEANKRVSLQRSEAVKRVLGQWLIPGERVETVGGGINRTAANATEARTATTIEIIE